MKEKTFSEKFNLFRDSMSEVFVNEKLLSQQLSFIQSQFEKTSLSLNSNNNSNNNHSLYSPSSLIKHPFILYIAVIAFNHKKGTIIEATYPDEQTTIKDPLLSLLDPNKAPIDNLNEINNQLCLYSLPDGIHLVKEDKEYFLIQNLSQTLYCASSYRQIQTSNSCIIEDDQENTRECIQKALCIISTLPLFEFFSNKITATIDGYFTQKTLKDKSLMSLLYEQLATLVEESIDVYQLTISFNTYPVLLFCKERILSIIKLLLLEKRIVIFSQIPGNVCGFIFSLLSLCNPGGTLFSYINHSNKLKGFAELGLPLKLFNDQYRLYPLFTLYDMSQVLKSNSNFLIGTSNVLVLKSKEMKYDCVINLDEYSIDISKAIDEKLFEMSSKEKKLYTTLEKELKLDDEDNDSVNKMDFKSVKWFINESNNQIENQKIDSFFISYIKNFLFDLSLAIDIYRNADYDLSTLTLNEIIESDLFKTKKKKTEQGKRERCLRKIFFKYNIAFIVEWIKTNNFKEWFNMINAKHLSLQSIYMKNVNQIKIYYLNGDIYSGGLKEGLLNGLGYYFYYDLKQYYKGEWSEGKRNGHGNLSSNEALLFEGEWRDDEKNGYGSLITFDIKYSGYFKNNLMHGEGNLVNSNGDIYQGTFANGIKFGIGKMQLKTGEKYEGFFFDDKYEGKGVLTDLKGIKYQGSFSKGVLNGEVTVIFPDGTTVIVIFTNGEVKDNKAEVIDANNGNKSECEWSTMLNNHKCLNE